MKTLITTSRCLVVATLVLLVGCEAPPPESTQLGYRGTGMVDVQNSRADAEDAGYPAALPAVSSDGPRAGDTYQNVQVLGDLSVAEFTRLMTAITAWVSPEEGCNYCHNPANLASDDVYTKVVSRRMLEMTQDLNANWDSHVGTAGVNCYTCHRGNNVPEYIWFEEADEGRIGAGWRNEQNRAAANVGYTSMPSNSLSVYLSDSSDPSEVAARVASTEPFPSDHDVSIQETESVYGLMMSLSQSLGVNCTYCHNTASFGNWDISTAAREVSWHGLQMVRSLNADYLVPLQGEYPEERLGPTGDAPKAYCGTCHQGQFKPLNGEPAYADYPALHP